MPRGDGTGPYGVFINCTDPATGLTRPLYRYRYEGGSPIPSVVATRRYFPPRSPINLRYYGYAPLIYPYGGYGYPRYLYRGYGHGLGIRRGGGRGKGRW
jgi:hypothetical protein